MPRRRLSVSAVNAGAMFGRLLAEQTRFWCEGAQTCTIPEVNLLIAKFMMELRNLFCNSPKRRAEARLFFDQEMDLLCEDLGLDANWVRAKVQCFQANRQSVAASQPYLLRMGRGRRVGVGGLGSPLTPRKGVADGD